MLFTDEESRHAYHQAPVLLQVVCQVLETYLASHGIQLELVDTDRRGGMWLAAVAIDSSIQEEAILDVIGRVNANFARTDELETCVLENAEVGLLSVRITETSDFSTPH